MSELYAALIKRRRTYTIHVQNDRKYHFLQIKTNSATLKGITSEPSHSLKQMSPTSYTTAASDLY